MLPKEIIASMVEKFGNDFRIISERALGGGSINQAARIETNQGLFFIKWNNAKAYPQMFEKEAASLKILDDTQSIRIPKVLMYNESGKDSFLVLEYIESRPPKTDFWQDFAYSLAALHKHSNDSFGLDFDNYIGSLWQSNRKHSSWADLFVEERMLPQIKMARDSGLLYSQQSRDFDKLFSKLEGIFPEEKPALLHGDLWSGNFMADEKGQACIFDPAIYYGNRIMDIAMSRMFGGFSSDFYRFYNEAFPMEHNWEEQTEVANLYPNLVHLNLFGTAYLSAINRILKYFTF